MSTGMVLLLSIVALCIAVLAERDVFYCRRRRQVEKLPEDVQ